MAKKGNKKEKSKVKEADKHLKVIKELDKLGDPYVLVVLGNKSVMKKDIAPNSKDRIISNMIDPMVLTTLANAPRMLTQPRRGT